MEIKGVEVTEVYDNNGQYENPNITVEDASGNSIQLYKAVLGDKTIEVGDTLNIKASVGVYNSTLQLRNTSPDEITVTSGGDTPEPGPTSAELAENIAEGDIVVVYHPNSGNVMGTAVHEDNGDDELKRRIGYRCRKCNGSSVRCGSSEGIPAGWALRFQK